LNGFTWGIRAVERPAMSEAPATPVDPDVLVRDNIALVGYLVSEIITRLPAHLSRDELTSAGLEALVRSSRSFDPTRGVPFGKFAGNRIRGALLDELRQHDWASRSVRAKTRKHNEAIEHLTIALRQKPTSAQVAEFLGISVSEVEAAATGVQQAAVLSLQGFADPDVLDRILPSHERTPEQELVSRERMAYLGDAVSALPERYRHVVQAYYLEERPMAEIAEELGVSESRVSQIRAEALALMKDGMNAQLDPDQVAASDRPGHCVDRRRSAYFSAVAASSDFKSRIATRADGSEAAPGTRITA
jgi:RNA polymerase sigma factor for flagellar operon FliA